MFELKIKLNLVQYINEKHIYLKNIITILNLRYFFKTK